MNVIGRAPPAPTVAATAPTVLDAWLVLAGAPPAPVELAPTPDTILPTPFAPPPDEHAVKSKRELDRYAARAVNIASAE
jgi:hypothetical protein